MSELFVEFMLRRKKGMNMFVGMELQCLYIVNRANKSTRIERNTKGFSLNFFLSSKSVSRFGSVRFGSIRMTFGWVTFLIYSFTSKLTQILTLNEFNNREKCISNRCYSQEGKKGFIISKKFYCQFKRSRVIPGHFRGHGSGFTSFCFL